nr:FecR domain-containing protein [uncultured Dyadobacter sp.]
MEPAITKEFVFNYFAGNCTALQKKLVQDWARDECNRELFFLWLTEWERKNIQYNVDVDAGIERHRTWVRSLNEAHAGIPETSRKGGLWRRWSIAASVALAMVSAGWFLKDEVMFRSHRTAYGQIEKVLLPDGSKVVLNGNSVLKVPRFGFGDGQRAVFLEGEASFDVVHTQSHQRFLVRTGDQMDIEVLGTEFNVYARSSGSQVVLQKGKVKLNFKEGNSAETIIMKPGDLARREANGKLELRYAEHPQEYSDWKFHRFVFNDLTFREICTKLEEVFGTKIIVEDSDLAQQQISGSFTALDAEEMLEILSEAQDFSYTRKGGDIVVSQRREARP